MQSLVGLLGLPILSIETGKQIGEVEEVLLSLDTALFYGVIVKDAAWFSDKRILYFSDIYRVGSDAVMVNNETVVHPYSQAERDEQVHALRQIQGKSIFSETGVNIGVLSDLTFDPKTGELKAYRVSDGTITDLLYGRKDLPLPSVQVVCEERIIIPESMTKLLHP